MRAPVCGESEVPFRCSGNFSPALIQTFQTGRRHPETTTYWGQVKVSKTVYLRSRQTYWGQDRPIGDWSNFGVSKTVYLVYLGTGH
jgi:hypothetical protein